jgi:predicted ATPase with chaperone activity
LLDRIAVHVSVRPVDIDAWQSSTTSSMTTAAMRELVVRAREIQARRFAETNGVDCNARIPEGMFASYCAMETAAEALGYRQVCLENPFRWQRTNRGLGRTSNRGARARERAHGNALSC